MINAERLRERIQEVGLNQSELARRVGVTQGTIAKLVNGHANDSAHIYKIARELRTTPEYLLNESDELADDDFNNGLSADELALITLYRQLDEANRQALQVVIQSMAGRSTVHSPARSYQLQSRK